VSSAGVCEEEVEDEVELRRGVVERQEQQLHHQPVGGGGEGGRDGDQGQEEDKGEPEEEPEEDATCGVLAQDAFDIIATAMLLVLVQL
jgi:hypothetical protein